MADTTIRCSTCDTSLPISTEMLKPAKVVQYSFEVITLERYHVVLPTPGGGLLFIVCDTYENYRKMEASG